MSDKYEVYAGGQVPIKAFTRGVPFETAALKQAHNVSRLPFIHKHVAVMPDVHAGYGCTVGSVIPTVGAIIPACVGVDIGCGMVAVRTGMTSEDLPEDLSEWRAAIEHKIPVGRSAYDNRHMPEMARAIWTNLLRPGYDEIAHKHPDVAHAKVAYQMGTLGGGNHFIELCLDEDDRVWLMLHSGSRGVGNRIGTYFTALARREMERFFIQLPDRDLAYFPEGTEHFDEYINAMEWAQNYARLNRDIMMDTLQLVLMPLLDKMPAHRLLAHEVAVNCHHNYTTRENHFGSNVWLTRKGAVCAREGVLGIIPGSMGAKSFIVEGKGNPDSFDSCSHGAGRVMSRTKAKATFTVEDHIRETEGVECRKDEGVLDETPQAYKNIDDVMKAQDSLVSIKHTLKAVLCIKG
jgi:tRNA-splicing ligase RtcB